MDAQQSEPKIALIGGDRMGLAAALAVSMAIPFYLNPEDMPFDPPLSSKVQEPERVVTQHDIDSIRKAREKRERRRLKRMDLVKPPFEPRYDDVFEEGVAWLDSL